MENNNGTTNSMIELASGIKELTKTIKESMAKPAEKPETRAAKKARLNEEITNTTDSATKRSKQVELAKVNREDKSASARPGSANEIRFKRNEAKEIMKLEEEGTEAHSKAQKDKQAANKEYYDKIASEAAKYGAEATKMTDGIKALAKADAEEKTKEAEDANKKEKEDLKNKYNQGLISKKEYDAGVIKSDKDLENKKNKINEDQQKAEKATAITKVLIETAVAIMKALSSGPIMAPILIGIIAATSALQIAAISKATAPKARKGGIISGGSHENGGVLIEAEGGEAILSRAAMSAFPGVANLMNAAALNGGINDGGYAARSMVAGSVDFRNRSSTSSAQGIDYEKLSSMMSEKISQTKLYVAVTDINNGQKNYARISDMARL